MLVGLQVLTIDVASSRGQGLLKQCLACCLLHGYGCGSSNVCCVTDFTVQRHLGTLNSLWITGLDSKNQQECTDESYIVCNKHYGWRHFGWWISGVFEEGNSWIPWRWRVLGARRLMLNDSLTILRRDYTSKYPRKQRSRQKQSWGIETQFGCAPRNIFWSSWRDQRANIAPYTVNELWARRRGLWQRNIDSNSVYFWHLANYLKNLKLLVKYRV